jgi:polysaccharide biosynthesis/export protein
MCLSAGRPLRGPHTLTKPAQSPPHATEFYRGIVIHSPASPLPAQPAPGPARSVQFASGIGAGSRGLAPIFVAPLLALAGCVSSSGWLAGSGPSRSQVAEEQKSNPQIPVIEVNDEVARNLLAAQAHRSFADSLPARTASFELLLGPGDVVAISVWEAAPAVLFGVATGAEAAVAAITARATTLPDQMVAADGTISVPFAGLVKAAGKTPHQIEAEIVERLHGKANQPQVLVSVSRNVTSNVTVVGEVTQSLRMPLTAKGERVLDAMAAAGGVRQPLGKITVQLSRGDQVLSMPMDAIVRDARQNVMLEGGDVLAALYQPLSFTALGATGKNDEINFEAQGITLAQALGRVSGLQDARSDARGVFIFRFEQPALVQAGAQPLPKAPDGTIPVVYRMDLKDPRSFLIAQDFPMHDKDVMYVANASSAELQKFLAILSSAIYSVYSVIHLNP